MARNISLRYEFLADPASLLVLAEMFFSDMSSAIGLIREIFFTLSTGETRFCLFNEVDETCRQVNFRCLEFTINYQENLLRITIHCFVQIMGCSLVVSERIMIFVSFVTQIADQGGNVWFVMVVLHMPSAVWLVAELFATLRTCESSISFDHKIVNSWRRWILETFSTNPLEGKMIIMNSEQILLLLVQSMCSSLMMS